MSKEQLRWTEAIPTVQDYLDLRIATGLGAKPPQEVAERALANSLYMICAYQGQRLVCFARIAGDGALSYIINSVMVAPEFQGQGLGKALMQAISDWLIANADASAYVCLMAKEPADQLYQQFGFQAIPGNIGMRWLKP